MDLNLRQLELFLQQTFFFLVLPQQIGSKIFRIFGILTKLPEQLHSQGGVDEKQKHEEKSEVSYLPKEDTRQC